MSLVLCTALMLAMPDMVNQNQFHPVKMVQPKPIRFVIAEDCKIFIDDILATWDDLQDGMECTMYHIRGLIYEIRAKTKKGE